MVPAFLLSFLMVSDSHHFFFQIIIYIDYVDKGGAGGLEKWPIESQVVMVYTLIDSTSETGGTAQLWMVKILPLFFFCFLGEFLDCENSVYISILDGQMLSTSINGSLWSTHPCNGLLWLLGLWQLRSRPKLGWSISDTNSSHMVSCGICFKIDLKTIW